MDLSEELLGEIGYSVESKIQAACQDVAERYVEENLDTIIQSVSFNKAAYACLEEKLPTMIGNRLRCGIYDNRLVKDIFDKCIDDELKKQVRSEVRSLVRNLIKDEIVRYMDTLKDSINFRTVEYRLEQEDKSE